MKLQSAAGVAVDLDSIVLTIANSPIIVRCATLEARLTDWEKTRRSSDIEEVILAWIASHVGRRRSTRLS